MKTIDILNYGISSLKKSNFDTPELDSKIFLSKILNTKLSDLIFIYQKELTKEEIDNFNKLIKRRLKGEPVAKIINEKFFWNYSFYVDNNVLDPRPDTESLIELILEDYKDEENLTILDLGCGSGCIILTLLKLLKNSSGVAVDLSEKALNITKKNAEKLQIKNIDFKQSNWNDDIDGNFDIIISNPPYIPTNEIENLAKDVKDFDPKIALDGGVDGLNYYRYLAKNIKKNCKPTTKLYFEIGSRQAYDVQKIFEGKGFKLLKIRKDLSGIERVISFGLE